MTAAAVDTVSTRQVDAVMRPLCRTEPSIGDVRRMLRLLGRHQQMTDLIDALVPEGGSLDVRESRALGAIQAMCWQAEHVLSKLQQAVQDAPIEGLNEAVREFASYCKGPRCSETVYPWSEFAEWCSADCRNDYAAERGEDVFDGC